MEELKVLNEKEYEDLVINSKGTVLVDFFATWCGPCKMLAPILHSVSEQENANYKIYKIDVDECLDIAKSLGIMSVPTMVIFKDGKEVNKLIGLRQKSQIIDALNL